MFADSTLLNRSRGATQVDFRMGENRIVRLGDDRSVRLRTELEARKQRAVSDRPGVPAKYKTSGHFR